MAFRRLLVGLSNQTNTFRSKNMTEMKIETTKNPKPFKKKFFKKKSSKMSFMDGFTKAMSLATLGIVIIGIIGNLLMFIVYSQPNIRKLSLANYFRTIAIVNIVANIISANSFASDYFKFYFLNISLFSCQLFNFLIMGSGAVSALSLIHI